MYTYDELMEQLLMQGRRPRVVARKRRVTLGTWERANAEYKWCLSEWW